MWMNIVDTMLNFLRQGVGGRGLVAINRTPQKILKKLYSLWHRIVGNTCGPHQYLAIMSQKLGAPLTITA